LSSKIEKEDRQTIDQYGANIMEEEDLQDNDEGWVNEVDLLTDEQSVELQTNI
jgi:hypothetical protein